jgi:hypothetical protein
MTHILATTLSGGGGSSVSNPPMFFAGLALVGLIIGRMFRGRGQ